MGAAAVLLYHMHICMEHSLGLPSLGLTFSTFPAPSIYAGPGQLPEDEGELGGWNATGVGVKCVARLDTG